MLKKFRTVVKGTISKIVLRLIYTGEVCTQKCQRYRNVISPSFCHLQLGERQKSFEIFSVSNRYNFCRNANAYKI